MLQKILILTPRFPYPIIGGDKLRVYSIAKGLKEAGFEPHLISFLSAPAEIDLIRHPDITSVFRSVRTVTLPKWRSYLNVLAGLPGGRPLQALYYGSGKMKELVDKEVAEGRYAAVIAHLTRMAPYAAKHKGVVRVLEMTDAMSLNYMRSREYGSTGFLGKIYRLEEKRIRRYEQECVRQFDSSVVVSGVDRDHLAQGLAGEAGRKLTVIAHGVADEMLDTKALSEDPNLMVFIGNMRTHQNSDAVLYFARDIYPLIRAERPDAKLSVVGASPSSKIRVLDGKNNIRVTGEVERIADHAAPARVSVCPVRIGAGMRGKILESMAMGIPVVSTAVGAEGIEGAVSGEHLVLADTPADFAAAVLKIMNDPVLRAKLRANGKRLVEERYRYGVLGREYAELIRGLLESSS